VDDDPSSPRIGMKVRRDRRGLRAPHARGLRAAGPRGAGGGAAVTWVGLAVAVVLALYLLASLLFPERF
jgi:K+-transporting ATPase KdpF subunit